MSRRDANLPEAPFEEPWQAQAFALVVALNEAGLLGWADWANALSQRLHEPGAEADGFDYYARWLKALEDVLAAREIAAPADVERLAAAWKRAAWATPHGKPILLENDPEASGVH